MWTYDLSSGLVYQNGVVYYKALPISLADTLPPGLYAIAPGCNDRRMGDMVLKLTPLSADETPCPSRKDYYIHGPEAYGQHTAPYGCIILPHAQRAYINGQVDRTLKIVSGVTEKNPAIRENFIA